MKKIFLAFLLVLICPFVLAQTPPGPIPTCPAPTYKISSGSDLVLKWTAPTINTDGTAISGAITYNLYSITGTNASLIASGLTTTSSIRSKLNAGSPCYAVTASVGGVESGLSSPATLLVVTTPAAPSGLTCTLNIPAGGGQVTGSCTTS